MNDAATLISCNLCPARVDPADGEDHIRQAHAEVLGETGDGHHYQPMWDTDRDVLTVACTWHRHYWRCPYDGQAPFGGPPVAVDEIPTAEEALAFAVRFTGGARQIVQHRGSMRAGDHGDGAACWCEPTVWTPGGDRDA